MKRKQLHRDIFSIIVALGLIAFICYLWWGTSLNTTQKIMMTSAGLLVLLVDAIQYIKIYPGVKTLKRRGRVVTIMLSVAFVVVLASLLFGTPTPVTVAKPWITSSGVAVARDAFALYPAKIAPANVPRGAVIDNWIDDTTFAGRPDYTLKAGEPITINIENYNTEERVIYLVYHVPDSITTDINTGTQYNPAPKEAEKWIEISASTVTIPANSIAHIPLRISIPREEAWYLSLNPFRHSSDIPKTWEFDIKVTDNAPGFVTTAQIQRWLITMR